MEKAKNNGCLWMFLAVVCTCFGYGFLKIIGISTLFSFIVSFGLSFFVSNLIVGKPKRNFRWIGMFVAILFLALFSFLISAVTNGWERTHTESFNNSEAMARGTMVVGLDTIQVYRSNRIWNDNYGKNYTASLTIREQDYLALYKHLEGYRARSNANFWGDLYDYIDRTDTPKLDLVLNAFAEIQREQQLDQMEFAEMVVSCIQDIPYAFVFEAACMPAKNYEYSIRKVLEECPACCVGGVKFGVQNPLSFLQSLKGDCDSRTVLIYSILKHFDYDVAILNSDFYRHSILGINLPASGTYKTHYGKRYVLWETTAKYFKAGDLPANFNDVTHWNVVLTSK
ncbi:MAG TPA: hypothetical protein EYN07_02195 [Flavobacteriaceae bacterium]|nr:hypothetical protein [Flavobacteriaceae bacterium]HIN98031.1 hypothetical protein [Flavobacteriaceae bacterium]